ncbi:MAG TPA: non-heme iron oxygenase ferredoxin subunit, partial [Candidatus Limnocylindrales bacterium]|nr:non-heme iron oxygenase ferredoxin subunit [Candidatus Limnocylindrales bacterium]
ELGRALGSWTGPRTARRVRAVTVDDVAGRLGVVARLDDPEAGPIAVYHVGGAVYAAGDVCPHAGAKLSEGALDGATVTCPLHGSQFDVRSGERLRGPADVPVPTYRVAVEGGVAFIELDAP